MFCNSLSYISYIVVMLMPGFKQLGRISQAEMAMQVIHNFDVDEVADEQLDVPR